jgi:hypothetical protein
MDWQNHPNSGKPFINLWSTWYHSHWLEGVWFRGVPVFDLLSDCSVDRQIRKGALKNLRQQEYHSAGPGKIVVSGEDIRAMEVL